LEDRHVILFSGAHGEGFGAERVLEHLLSTSRTSIALLVAPQDSSAARVAYQVGIPIFPWCSHDNSTLGNILGWLRFDANKIENRKLHLLHAWHTRGFEWALALGKRTGLPVCGTLHDDPTSERNSKLRRFLIRSAGNRMKGLAVVSEALHQVCLGEDWSVPMTVIPNGLPDAPIVPQSREINAPLRVGFLGLNEVWKGIETVAALVEALEARSIAWELFGSPSPQTQPLIDSLLTRFRSSVHFHGRRTPTEIFSHVDIVFHPSISFDPYPTVLLEAARAGIPVVASAVGGAPEIVEDKKTGLLFPAGDVAAAKQLIEFFLTHPDIRFAFGTAARARYLECFQVARMAESYDAFWRNLTSPSFSLNG
jgi:glycosyltransferase involved in cell wall biosynthesis